MGADPDINNNLDSLIFNLRAFHLHKNNQRIHTARRQLQGRTEIRAPHIPSPQNHHGHTGRRGLAACWSAANIRMA